MIETARNLLELAGQYPGLATLVAFLVAMVEAVVVVGLFVPATVILVGLAGMTGLGHLPFWPIFLATVAGSVTGDAVSFAIGRYYGGRLRTARLMARYTGIIDAGERFFRAHGNKSVVIGRFVPGVKTVVPAVAGMMGLRPARFAALTSIAALLWTTAHLVPGYSAGAALLITGTISKRLVVVLLALGASAVLVLWLARLGFRLGARALPRAQTALARWSAAQPPPHGPLILRLVSPDHEDFRLLILLLAMFAAAILGGAALIEAVVSGDAVVRLDASVSAFLQSLRTGIGDRLMVGATMLGDKVVTTGVTAAAAAALALSGRRQLALGLVVAVLGAVGFVFVLKGLVQAPRPSELYAGVDSFSFPSGHATNSATLYGVLGLIALRGLSPAAGRRVAMALALLVAAIAFSRVYLAAHWPSDVAEGLLFGFAAASGLALVFRGYDIPRMAARRTLGAAAVALAVIGAWHIDRSHARMAGTYARPAPPLAELAQPWRDGGWQALPTHRTDLAGTFEEQLVLQWRGDADSLMAALRRLGWIAPPPWSIGALNAFVLPGSASVDLAVVPSLHNGRPQALVAVLPDDRAGAQGGRHVLRAWEQEALEPGGPAERILLASIVHQAVERPFGILSLPLRDTDGACDAGMLIAGLPNAVAVGPALPSNRGACGGRTILAEEPSDRSDQDRVDATGRPIRAAVSGWQIR